TTRLADRRDPMLGLAAAVLAARAAATELDAVATVGRVVVDPNSANWAPGQVSPWVDARAAQAQTLDWLVTAFQSAVEEAAGRKGLTAALAVESRSPGVSFDADLTARLATALRATGLEPPGLPTAAAHHAGALAPARPRPPARGPPAPPPPPAPAAGPRAAAVPPAMLFVRNPTGTSHSPSESATLDDCLEGVRALAAVIEESRGR